MDKQQTEEWLNQTNEAADGRTQLQKLYGAELDPKMSVSTGESEIFDKFYKGEGYAHKIKNGDRHHLADKFYVQADLFVKSGAWSHKPCTYLFTEEQLEQARLRAIKNRDDLLKKPGLLELIARILCLRD
jgi:hypothetical protein